MTDAPADAPGGPGGGSPATDPAEAPGDPRVGAPDADPGGVRLDTGRLLLRPIRPQEARAVLRGKTPPGMVLADGYPSRFTVEVMELLLDGNQLGPHGPYFMIRKSDGAAIGEIGCRADEGCDTGEAGYSVIEPCWGQGYATEALTAVLGHVLAQPGMRRVIAQTLIGHRASRRVMEKAGMRYAGRQQGTEDGRPVELAVYEITAADQLV